MSDPAIPTDRVERTRVIIRTLWCSGYPFSSHADVLAALGEVFPLFSSCSSSSRGGVEIRLVDPSMASSVREIIHSRLFRRTSASSREDGLFTVLSPQFEDGEEEEDELDDDGSPRDLPSSNNLFLPALFYIARLKSSPPPSSPPSSPPPELPPPPASLSPAPPPARDLRPPSDSDVDAENFLSSRDGIRASVLRLCSPARRSQVFSVLIDAGFLESRLGETSDVLASLFEISSVVRSGGKILLVLRDPSFVSEATSLVSSLKLSVGVPSTRSGSVALPVRSSAARKNLFLPDVFSVSWWAR